MNETSGLIHVEYLENPSFQIASEDYTILYVLKGNVLLTGEKETRLQETMMTVFNPGTYISLQSTAGSLIAVLTVNRRDLAFLCNGKRKYILFPVEANETKDGRKLRRLISAYLSAGLAEEPALAIHKHTDDLLLFLITGYANNNFGQDEDPRKQKISAWIESSYDQDLRLDAAAEHFGYTPQYFARLFKSLFHVTFMDYVNTLRLEAAEEELRYGSSSMLRTALTCGFSSLSSFNRLFAAKHGMSPSVWKKENRTESTEIDKTVIADALNAQKEKDSSQVEEIRIENAAGEPIQRYWKEIINLGRMSELSGIDVMDQLRKLQSQLHFHFGRVFLDLHAADREGRTGLEEIVMKNIVSLGLTPWLVIDYRDCAEDEGFEEYLDEFLHASTNRYGSSAGEMWVVEIFYDTEFNDEKALAYRDFFQRIERVLIRYGFRNICGPGLHMDEDGSSLRTLLAHIQCLSSLTISCAPYFMSTVHGHTLMARTTDPDYLLHQYELACTILREFHADLPVHIISWCDDLNPVSILNDSPYRGARILQMYIRGYGRLHDLALACPLDLMCSGDARKVMSGLQGLLSVDAVPKPSCHALQFLNKTDELVLYHDQDILATGSDQQYLQILLQNCIKPNLRYFETEAETVAEGRTDIFFDQEEPKHYRLVIHGVSDRDYIVKIRTVNEECGNTLRCWQKMNYPDASFLGIDDMEYLCAMARPVITSQTYHARDSKLVIDCCLEPNEIKHLHIIPKR